MKQSHRLRLDIGDNGTNPLTSWGGSDRGHVNTAEPWVVGLLPTRRTAIDPVTITPVVRYWVSHDVRATVGGSLRVCRILQAPVAIPRNDLDCCGVPRSGPVLANPASSRVSTDQVAKPPKRPGLRKPAFTGERRRPSCVGSALLPVAHGAVPGPTWGACRRTRVGPHVCRGAG
jgi:hypothetical protein